MLLSSSEITRQNMKDVFPISLTFHFISLGNCVILLVNRILGSIVTCEKGCESCIAAVVAAATIAAVAPNCAFSPPPLIAPVPPAHP